MEKQFNLSVPEALDFADLGLWHDQDTGHVQFNWSAVHELADYNQLDRAIFANPDNVGALIAAWYQAHLLNGGDKDMAAERMFNAVAAEYNKPVQIWDNVPVEPPTPEQIKALRQKVGTQAKCAKLAGVNISNWQRWEKGEQRPHPATWGMFLLSCGQHPLYRLVTV